MEPTEDDLRIIRTLIPDTDAVFGPTEDDYMFSDANLSDFYTAGRGNVLRAAGYACYALGTSEALINKVIQTQDLSTNGAQTSDAIRKHGDALFLRADKDDAQATIDYFEIVDYRDGWDTDRPELTEWV